MIGRSHPEVFPFPSRYKSITTSLSLGFNHSAILGDQISALIPTVHFPWLRHDFVDLPIVESVVSDCGDKVWSQIIHIIY